VALSREAFHPVFAERQVTWIEEKIGPIGLGSPVFWNIEKPA
jgi:hypothetical protein